MYAIEDFQKFGKDNMDLAVGNLDKLSKSMQAIATEMTDYSRKSFEDSSSAFEKMLAAKSLDKAIEVQSDYAKATFDGFVSQMTKIGEMYTDMAKDAYKPFESMTTKFSK
ncbi:MAG: phasin family protein [Rhodobiaceae bacterium]|nr:phasin family protein [Rhodobiaceae bacterium]